MKPKDALDKLAKFVPPNDENAEEMLIGAMLKFPESFIEVQDMVSPDQFYAPWRGAIWEAMQYLHEDGIRIDTVSVGARLEEMKRFKEADYKLNELYVEALTAASAKMWAERIVSLWKLRVIRAEAGHILGLACDNGGDPDDLIERLSAIEEKVQSRRPAIAKTVSDVACGVVADIIAAKRNGVRAGVCTGFIDVDKLTGGYRPGELFVLGARPGMGKTAFAGNTALEVGTNRPVLFISIEMSDSDIAMRLLSSLGGINGIYLRDARISDTDIDSLERARVRLADSKLWIADLPNATVGQISGLARRVKHKCGDLALIVVDYLQLVTHPVRDMNRQEQVAEISRRLKALARQLNCTVLALSQLSRKVEERTDKRPMMSDLRESGAIEQDADVVAFLYRHEEYHPTDHESRGKAEFIIGKSRKGVTGVVNLAYHAPTTTFRSLAENCDQDQNWPFEG